MADKSTKNRNSRDWSENQIDSSTLARSAKPEKERKKGRGLMIVALIMVIIIALGIIGANYIRSVKNGDAEISSGVKQSIKSLAESTEVMQYAKSMKEDLKTVLLCLKEQDIEGAEKAREALGKDITDIRAYMSSPIMKTAAITPVVGNEIKSANELVDLAADATETLLDPLIAQMKEYPVSELKVNGGINVALANSYLDLLIDIMPQVETVAEKFNSIDVGLFDTDGKITEYKEKMNTLMDKYLPILDYVPAIRTILGTGEDRLYFLAAQNSAEIRSSGGFLGAGGLIAIKDGVLTISDFQAIRSIFEYPTPYEAHIIGDEVLIFNGRLNASWDADFCPDFERVGEIWAKSYEYYQHTPVDGVISATPAIIQRLLSVIGDLTLPDGTVINGENATKYLEHDIYFKYLDAGNDNAANEYVDGVFAVAAKETINLLISSFGVDKLGDYWEAFNDCVEERTLMFYMCDAEEQKIIKEAGWAANLNEDPENPKIGVFINSDNASKMGWYVDIDTQIGEAVENADGTKTYDVSVKFTNTITPEEIEKAGQYILGGYNGRFNCCYYITAPAGGTVSDFKSDGYQRPMRYEYNGRMLGYANGEVIEINDSITVTFKATTAADSAELGVITTPTMQAYR